MKLTIELDTANNTDAAMARLFADALHAMNGQELTTPEAAANQARETNKGKVPNAETVDALNASKNGEVTRVASIADDDEARPYKGTTEGRSRRTKAEIAEDEKIEALFEEHKDAPGMPKKIPTDQPAANLLAELEAMEPEDDDGGFEVEDTDTEGEPLDMDEFRAILNKAIKAVGGKTVGEIMSPHKNASSVPEDERREFADQLQKAMDTK